MNKLKRIFAFALAICSALVCARLYASGEGAIDTTAKSLILVEQKSGKVLYEFNADEGLPPASVTKIMTLLLVMEAIDGGKMTLEEEVNVSARAAGMGGSQVYLEEGERMTAEDMIKCVVIASANDAAAALAEHVCGSLEGFVEKMNERAKELGMEHTHFENTNGLDDTATSHFTSARDIAIMSAELLKHEKILNYTGIWMDSIRDGAFTLTNTNRLIRFYKGANGLKTGSTSKAGFCISATAKRDGMQLIAVVMGSPTRDARNADAAKLLDYGFANYEIFDFQGEERSLPVTGGKEKEVSVCADPCSFVLSKGEKKRVETRIELPKSLKAPCKAGTIVGKVGFFLDGREVTAIEFRVGKDVARVDFSDVFIDLFSAYTFF